MSSAKLGTMAWLDLSVENAEQVKGFYQQVIGWQSEAVSMGEYEDFAMIPTDSKEPVTGICHAKGVNSDLPAAWLPYFLVADIEQAIQAVIEHGGSLITDIKEMSGDKYVVIKDPAGAVCALYQTN